MHKRFTCSKFFPAAGLLLFLLGPQRAAAQWDTLRLVFAGDIMGHIQQIESAEVVRNKQYDYSPCFRYIKPVIADFDLAIGNLELTLPGRSPYTGYPMFRSPNALAAALKEAGFDVLATANNHCNDARGTGLSQTIQTLRDLGFLQTGTFKSQRDRDAFYPLMIYKNGFKIALLNYTYGTNGMPTDKPTVVNLIDTTQIKRDLAEAVARKPDLIAVFMHWGLENQLTENAEQRRLAKWLVAHGADIIIGAHPHVVQPIKVEKAVSPEGVEREAVVAYSLGNFISGQTKPNTDRGILFHFELIKNKGVSKARIGDYGYIPLWRYVHREPSGKSTYFVLPVARMEANPDLFPDMDPEARKTMSESAESIRKRLSDR